ncbi:hypothetical protein [Paraclostridium sordellii]|uniref:hypothetical protein n=1 Tax=Paraclostridium sordellii TaxID=1505 RepID=UPI0005E1AFA5|nr:hypothetical protein [Paeniclostridium sordellii]CEO26415.1 Uncharacterised protein [[Clostridium] sordellii] [Paeniclostridium sordellii]
MNNIIFTALVSSLFTGIVGFISFILSNVYFKSIQRYKELRGETVSTLIFYKNILTNPIDLADMKDNKVPDEYIIASNEIRKLSSKWYGLTIVKPLFSIGMPRNKKIINVAKNLIGLSNSTIYPYNQKDMMMVNETIKMIDSIVLDLKIKIDI